MTIRRMSKTTATLAVTVAAFVLIHYLCKLILGYRIDALDSLMGRNLKYYTDDYNRILFRLSTAMVVVAVLVETILMAYTGVEILSAIKAPFIVFALFVTGAIVLDSVKLPGGVNKTYIILSLFYLALFVNLRVLFSALAIPKNKGKGLFSFVKNLPDDIMLGNADEKILTVIRLLVYLNWLGVGVSMVLYALKNKEMFMHIFGY